MKTYVAKLRSTTPYSQSKHFSALDVPPLEKEGKDSYEKRTWRHRMHVDSSGHVFIPAQSLKNCLSEAAKFLGIQIPGKGKSTYTKHFEAGLMILGDIKLPVRVEDVPGDSLYVPADGVRGSGKRVTKIFGRIDSWEGEVEIHVLDETITKDVLERHLIEAGRFIGIGRWRPRNNGAFGRFELESLTESV